VLVPRRCTDLWASNDDRGHQPFANHMAVASSPTAVWSRTSESRPAARNSAMTTGAVCLNDAVN